MLRDLWVLNQPRVDVGDRHALPRFVYERVKTNFLNHFRAGWGNAAEQASSAPG